MDIYTHITQENMEEKAATIKGNLVLSENYKKGKSAAKNADLPFIWPV